MNFALNAIVDYVLFSLGKQKFLLILTHSHFNQIDKDYIYSYGIGVAKDSLEQLNPITQRVLVILYCFVLFINYYLFIFIN